VIILFLAATARGHAAPSSEMCLGLAPVHSVTVTNVAGIPFLSFAPRDLAEGKSVEFSLHGITAYRLFLFGMVNNPDTTQPSWGGGDSFQNFFIGDSDGYLLLTYVSGQRDEIPLVFGYTIFWRQGFRGGPAPFSTDPAARARLDAALCVFNGLDAYRSNSPLCLCVIPRLEPLKSITLVDSPKKIGYPVLNGLTFIVATNQVQTNTSLVPLGNLALQPEINQWFKIHAVKATNPFPGQRQRAVQNLGHELDTTPGNITFKSVRHAAGTIQTTTNDLPFIRFYGPVEAEIMTEVYRENSAELLTRVEPDGMVRESNPQADNYRGFGGYLPRAASFKNTYYTRNWAPTLLDNWGQFEKASSALDYFDHWLMYFPQSYPKLQIGGKPVPGHATVICNEPHIYYDTLRNHGWPTRFTSRDMGNPETDGHGFMMLNHYNAWVKTGRSPEWVKAHWPEIREAAEYIPWQLDHPKLSFSEHGLLYSESEGGMEMESFYCNVPCWLGLKAFADMADTAGQTASATRWRSYADKMQAAMDGYYPKTQMPWGDIWDTNKTANWGGYPVTALAPVLFGLDYWGLALRGSLPPGWEARTDRTWKLAVTEMKPPWCASAGYGYGQAYYAIAGMLLDQTADTDQIIDWMARMIFAPSQPHPFRVPEGVTIAGDASEWRRWGDVGNLFQMGAVLRAIQVMTGFDDLSTNELRIIPRIPSDWQGVEITNQPVRALSQGRSQIARVDFKFIRVDSGQKLEAIINPNLPLDRVRLRLGPVSKTVAPRAFLDDHPIDAQTEDEGDACWVWLTFKNLAAGKHHIVVAP
jgi:hypothetical protein